MMTMRVSWNVPQLEVLSMESYAVKQESANKCKVL